MLPLLCKSFLGKCLPSWWETGGLPEDIQCCSDWCLGKCPKFSRIRVEKVHLLMLCLIK